MGLHLSGSTVASLSNAFVGTRKVNFVQDGDSIGWGTGSTDIIYSTTNVNNLLGQIKSGIDARHVFTNVSVPGSTIATQRTNAPTNVDAHLDTTPGVLNVLSLHCGTNDLFVSSGTVPTATVEGNIQGYCQERRAAGWNKIIVHTIMPRTDASTPVNHESKRLDLNTWLRANYASFADGLADTGGDTIMGDVTQTTSTYFYDLVHPTNRGYRLMATYVRPLLAKFGMTDSHVHRDQYMALKGIYVGAAVMVIRAGTPTLTFNNSTPVWSFAASATSAVCFATMLPDDWEYFRYEMDYAVAGSGSGSIRFDIFANGFDYTTNLVSGSLGVNNSVTRTTTEAGSRAGFPTILTAQSSIAVPPSRKLQMIIQRNSSGDTLTTSAVQLIGIRIYRWPSA